MEMVILVLVIMFVVGLLYGLYKFGLRFIGRQLRHENEILAREVEYYKKENEKLREAQGYWSNFATGAAQFNQQILQNHNQNFGATLTTVIGILQAMQQNPNNNLSADERQRVEQIIQQARAISPS